MKIGDLSKRTGVSIRMLRYYESEGLLKPPRTSGGYRVYDLTDQNTVERIKLLGAAGMTLATIERFLPCIRAQAPVFEPCDELRALLHQQIRLIDDKTAELARSRATLDGFLQEINRD
jgi:DNA-binding transcriptional MerR regulator